MSNPVSLPDTSTWGKPFKLVDNQTGKLAKCTWKDVLFTKYCNYCKNIVNIVTLAFLHVFVHPVVDKQRT